MAEDLRRAVQRLAAELTHTQADLARLRRGGRGPQLAHSSLTGHIDVIDPDTERVRLRIGRQPDGTVGLVATDGDAPPAPTAPGVTPSLAGLRITWDGQMANDQAVPADLAHVEVHVSTTSSFTPSAATRVGTITQAGDGGMLPVVPLPYTEHYVRLVGVTTSAAAGDPSAQTAGTPHQVDGPDITAGAITAGHITAGAVDADKLAALLVLASRIVAGDPEGGRVELNDAGLRAYNEAEELTVAVDADGSAAFSGDITGSTISGGAVSVLAEGDPESRIELNAGPVNAVIDLWPRYREGRTWFPGSLSCHQFGVRPISRLRSPREQGEAYSEIEMEGAVTGSDFTQIVHAADWHTFSFDPGTVNPSQVLLHQDVTLRADAHAPGRQDMLANPAFGTTGSFVDFASGDFPPIEFETGASGRVEVSIAISGNNSATANSSLALGFRLSGGSTVGASLKRSAYVRSIGSGVAHVTQTHLTVPLQLAAWSAYVLTPAYRISSGSSSTAAFDLALPNSIAVKNTL